MKNGRAESVRYLPQNIDIPDGGGLLHAAALQRLRPEGERQA
jgi:hypothetical protein